MSMQSKVKRMLAEGFSTDEIRESFGDGYLNTSINNAIWAAKRGYRPRQSFAEEPRHKPRRLGDMVEFAPGHVMRVEWAARLGYWRGEI